MTEDRERLNIYLNKVGNELKKYLEAIEDKKTISEISIVLRKSFDEIGDIDSKKEAYSRMAITIILSLSVLSKLGYLKEFHKNAKEFIERFLCDFFPLLDKESIKKVVSLDLATKDMPSDYLIKQLKRISENTWNKIGQSFAPELRIYFWEKLDKAFHSFNILIEYFRVNSKFKNIYPELVPGDYQTYLNTLHNKLQSRVFFPDLVLIDMVLLPEYMEKGVFVPIEHHLSGKDDLLAKIKASKGHINHLDCIFDGNLAAIPLTRNFHLPAWDKDFDRKFKEKLFEGGQNNDAKLLEKISEIIDKKYLNSKLFTTAERKDHGLFFSDIKSDHNLDVPLVTSMGVNQPFIPMQAAIGAHIVYSTFAYIAGGRKSIDDPSFVSIKQENGKINLDIWDQDKLEISVNLMLRCMYYYVPFLSLCADHNVAHWMRRRNSTHWFDPCLPIEAGIFEPIDTKLEFSSIPTKGNYGQPLSCLGGYCLALSNESGAKGDAADLASSLTTNYFDLIKNNTSGITIQKHEINCLSAPLFSNPDYPKEYIQLESINVSKRPVFFGWNILEDNISEIVRLYIATVLIYRSIKEEMETLYIDENCRKNAIKKYATMSSKGEEEILMDINSNISNEHFLEKYFIEKILNEGVLKDYLLKQLKDHMVKWINEQQRIIGVTVFPQPGNWVDANFDTIFADRLVILSLLGWAVRQVNLTDPTKGNQEEQVLKFISKSMSQHLIDKLNAISSTYNWK
jgi:hypothetical protein